MPKSLCQTTPTALEPGTFGGKEKSTMEVEKNENDF